MRRDRLASVIVSLTLIAAAATAMTRCQLFLHTSDCSTDADCTEGRRCNVQRHLCQIPPVEQCNGVDDNANGIADADENFGPCQVTIPAGMRGCREGTLRCHDNHTITCDARTQPDPMETCDNGIDDDCNGIVDDGSDCTANYGRTTGLQIGTDNPDEGEGDDAPAHSVCLDAFGIDRHEVTMAAFAVFLSSFDQSKLTIDRPPTPGNTTVVYGRYVLLQQGSESIPLLAIPNSVGPASFDRTAYAWALHDPTSANLPAVNVTWFGASRYCQWANKHLPTEAEFLRAARGATGTRPFPWGAEAPTCDRANVGRGGPDGGPCVGASVGVDQLQMGATLEGVFNLYGNVNEWMYDYLRTDASHSHNLYYESLPADAGADAASPWCTAFPSGPIGPDSGAPIAQPEDAGLYCVNCRFARGRHYRTVDLRIGIRRWLDADRGEAYVGFRCSEGGAVRP